MTSKGQITIPLEIRERYGLRAGVRIHFIAKDGESFEAVPVTRSIKDLAGLLPYAGPVITAAEMDESIAAAAAESMKP
jgi:antitoxin PrlF